MSFCSYVITLPSYRFHYEGMMMCTIRKKREMVNFTVIREASLASFIFVLASSYIQYTHISNNNISTWSSNNHKTNIRFSSKTYANKLMLVGYMLFLNFDQHICQTTKKKINDLRYFRCISISQCVFVVKRVFQPNEKNGEKGTKWNRVDHVRLRRWWWWWRKKNTIDTLSRWRFWSPWEHWAAYKFRLNFIYLDGEYGE